jgi:transcriptional regulator GlxA family with amidase domain
MIAMLSPASTAFNAGTLPPMMPPPSLPVAMIDTPPLPMLARGGLPPKALRRVREYVMAHLEESISVQALAAIVGLSRYHFARAFKQSEGVTPHRFLLQCRVRRAQELLAGTELSLSEIAIAAGFSDQSHCSRRFRELVGLTPSKYRWSTR